MREIGQGNWPISNANLELNTCHYSLIFRQGLDQHDQLEYTKKLFIYIFVFNKTSMKY